MSRRRPAGGLALAALAALAGAPAFAQAAVASDAILTEEEVRFFKGCPDQPIFQVHREGSPWDLHEVSNTVFAFTELEVFRLTDWTLDIAVPAVRFRPFASTFDALHRGYHRVPPWKPVQRFGELVDALQIPELSLGDIPSAHSLVTTGGAGPSTGLALRVQKLLDWTHHVSGDLNWLAGRPVGRAHGLVTWPRASRFFDGFRDVLVHTLNRVTVIAARTVEDTIDATEVVVQVGANAAHARRHRKNTVFVHLPPELYREHGAWIAEYRPRMVIGTSELFRTHTHAELAHAGRMRVPAPEQQMGFDPEHTSLVLMMDVAAFSRAPKAFRPYAVPAAQILHEPEPIIDAPVLDDFTRRAITPEEYAAWPRRPHA